MSIKESLEKYSIAAAVIVAGLLVAGAVVFTGWKQVENGQNIQVQPGNEPAENGPAADAYKNVKPVTDQDHIFGNKDAKVKIVNFSDMECPFCIRFEATMKQVVADYKGQVAWVYRQNPLEGLHQSAKPAAEASECVAAKAGNDKFWEFLNKFTEVVQKTDGGAVNVVDVAKQIGVDISDCYGKGTYDSKIAGDSADATASGLQGTPYSVVIVDGSPVASIDGAYPVDDVKKIIDQYLK